MCSSLRLGRGPIINREFSRGKVPLRPAEATESVQRQLGFYSAWEPPRLGPSFAAVRRFGRFKSSLELCVSSWKAQVHERGLQTCIEAPPKSRVKRGLRCQAKSQGRGRAQQEEKKTSRRKKWACLECGRSSFWRRPLRCWWGREAPPATTGEWRSWF